MDQHKEQEEKILKNGLKIKSLENANEILYNGVLELGGSMFRMMDEMEKSWKNKMSSLNRKTEAVEGKFGLLNEVLTKQKQARKDQISKVRRSIDLSQKVVVELQENLRNAFDEKEKKDKEYDLALQAQHWIADEKEEGWALSNQCLELEKAELKMEKAKLMEKLNREESKALFYKTEYNKAMGIAAEVQKMVANVGTPLTFEEYEKKDENKVMSRESRKLKRKLSTEDQKTDDEKRA
ncbi:hypothetical protein CAEBREN_20718 [Caenorhabditis brenneri]|uniref:Uncharacterized protein n=1 Tax=Caenorhabditis brenneri TaxID=135651 RepID=G0NDE2_CAEBE|nr:hypothetical protein CAEBREN_20718 [Caenorhabditis brenneri]